MTLFRRSTCRILKSGNPSVGFLRHAFRCLLRQQNRCSLNCISTEQTCVGTCMLWASGIGSLEHLITDPPLIAFRNDLSRAVCWFNFSHVIRHRRQHQSPMYLSNPTRRISSWLHSSRAEHDRRFNRSTARLKSEIILDQAPFLFFSHMYERLPRETNSYRSDPIRPRNLEQRG